MVGFLFRKAITFYAHFWFSVLTSPMYNGDDLLKYEINSVVALGYPAEQSQSEDAKDNTAECLKYYLDVNDQLHVPKRPLAAICHLDIFGIKP